jgi:hypothetical protein
MAGFCAGLAMVYRIGPCIAGMQFTPVQRTGTMVISCVLET